VVLLILLIPVVPFNMLASTDLKNGVTFMADGKPYKVVKYEFIKMGRGGATVKIKVRNLESGSVEEKSYSSNVKVDNLVTVKRQLQYLYTAGDTATFMDPSTYEQVEIETSVIESELPFIKEGETVTIMFWGEKPLSIDIPPKVNLKVAETDPGVKGNSASNMYKSAVMENGITVRVPLFIEKGEMIRVDTRTGEYVERAGK
jgi:elongation factor P